MERLIANWQSVGVGEPDVRGFDAEARHRPQDGLSGHLAPRLRCAAVRLHARRRLEKDLEPLSSAEGELRRESGSGPRRAGFVRRLSGEPEGV